MCNDKGLDCLLQVKMPVCLSVSVCLFVPQSICFSTFWQIMAQNLKWVKTKSIAQYIIVSQTLIKITSKIKNKIITTPHFQANENEAKYVPSPM